MNFNDQIHKMSVCLFSYWPHRRNELRWSWNTLFPACVFFANFNQQNHLLNLASSLSFTEWALSRLTSECCELILLRSAYFPL
jgi:hypothetical protein